MGSGATESTLAGNEDPAVARVHLPDSGTARPGTPDPHIETLSGLLDGCQPEDLRMLYNARLVRFLSDNNRIWTTGAIMIPLSLAAFAALATIDDAKTAHVVFLAVASLLTLLSWECFAEGHRAFQNKSEKWMTAIERRIGVDDPLPPKLPGSGLTGRIGAMKIQTVRWGLFWLVAAAWAVAIPFWPR